MKYSRWFTLVVLCSALVLPGVALAEEDAHGRMLELSAEAATAFRAGEYERAAAIFEEAYAYYPEPILLRNQMIALYALDRCEESRQVGERLLEDESVGEEDRAAISRVLAGCAERADEMARAEQEHRDAEAQREKEQDIVVSDEPTKAGPSVAAIGLSAGGALVAAFAAGWHYHAVANIEPEYLSVAEAGLDRSRYEELNGQLHRARTGIPVLYGLGGAMLATGIFLSLFHSGGGDDLGVAPTVSPNEVGATLRIRF